MILHLFNDQKICNRIVANFKEVFPDRNKFICFHQKGNLKYVENRSDIIFLEYGEKIKVDDILEGVDKVVIHFLDIYKIEFINQNIPLSSNIKIYWVLWGGDLYDEVLASKGYPIYYEQKFIFGLKFKLKEFIKSFLFPKKTRKYRVGVKTEFIASRIDYILTSDVEFRILKKYIGCEIKAECVCVGPIYYPIEDILGSLLGCSVMGNNIMIGNSASYSNNHVYAMAILSKLDTTGRIKHMPLSYSGSSRYIGHVIDFGLKLWGEEYYAIENFMSLDEYNKLMCLNNIYIYGNWRQESEGNIVIALYLGAKVFISKKSPLVEYFQSNGIKIYILESIKQSDIDNPEDIDVTRSNREAIMKLHSKDSILSNIREIFS